MECDVEPHEVPEDPAAQLQEHPLPDPPGPVQEEHPADGLDRHHRAQGGDDGHEFARRSTGQQRRDGMVDAALHQKRNRKPRNVFQNDHRCQNQHRRAIRAQQRPQQCPGLDPAPAHLVCLFAVGLFTEPAPPLTHRLPASDER